MVRNSDRWSSVGSAKDPTVGQVSRCVAPAPDRENERSQHQPYGFESAAIMGRIKSRSSRRRLIQGFRFFQTLRRRGISENFPFARAAGSRNKIISDSFSLTSHSNGQVERRHECDPLPGWYFPLFDFPPVSGSIDLKRYGYRYNSAPEILKPTRHINSCSQNDHRISRTRAKTEPKLAATLSSVLSSQDFEADWKLTR